MLVEVARSCKGPHDLTKLTCTYVPKCHVVWPSTFSWESKNKLDLIRKFWEIEENRCTV